uniref:Tyrosine-specific transport protein n=1 Tax=Klebsiella pneumoniae TaxID=573 RepID=A0A6G9HWJ9_KLEPN|nr:Tyrosine-specific transport protein [Klebsiella pneumoniae]
MVLRMKACPQHSTGKEGVTISLNVFHDGSPNESLSSA